MPILVTLISFLIQPAFSGPNELSANLVEFRIEKNHEEGTHSIMLDVAGKHGTVILTSESGKIINYQTFLTSTGEVVFEGLASGTYMICVKHDRNTFVETITIP